MFKWIHNPFSLMNKLKLCKYDHIHSLPCKPFFFNDDNGLNFVTCEHYFIIFVEEWGLSASFILFEAFTKGKKCSNKWKHLLLYLWKIAQCAVNRHSLNGVFTSFIWKIVQTFLTSPLCSEHHISDRMTRILIRMRRRFSLTKGKISKFMFKKVQHFPRSCFWCKIFLQKTLMWKMTCEHFYPWNTTRVICLLSIFI